MAIIAGCVSPSGGIKPPMAGELPLQPVVLHADFDVPRREAMLNEWRALQFQIAGDLELPPATRPIHVHLFASPERYRSFMAKHYPGLPARRAMFVETDRQLSVYAAWSEQAGEDLRHELTHAYLHAASPQLPLWLDEGLAEFYEVPLADRGVNRPHVALLLEQFEAGRWVPELHQMERLAAMETMTQLDYAEAWAWVHWLQTTSPARRSRLLQLLRPIEAPPAAAPLSISLATDEPMAAAELITHLRNLK